ncbi:MULTISPECIES: hypothetical protein [Bacillus]|uniref:Uncharacterized protein n=3 Tax=Bacillus amyloliquefaciens group TaxID=1938374 RepID=A0ABC8D9G6_BACVE|nr:MULTISPECIES: hypothetical protein [Bacillus]MBL3611670.1 hypothetical protein [Bacillus sp. RHFS18]AJC27109.1 hypothetical protein SB24_18845 [Bacillus sp. Pc3]AMQ71254.1 hypothetical protein BAMY6639_01455 [Bacillus amyloliquefaciens UMAF6639]ANB49426.1 hypothetical protein A1D33_019250 [Bacillus velezensis]AVI28848.1 hypothetical protein C3Z10_10860 [Bacillus velezensis]
MKKLFSFIVCTMVAILSLSFATAASAETGNSRFSTKLTSSAEGEFKAFGLNPPNSNSIVNLTKNKLTFAGQATGNTLYSNSYFQGKSSISYSITNNIGTKLTVKVWNDSDWIFATETLTVNANGTATGTIKNLDANALYYLSFSAPSDFSGYVQ